MTTKNLLMYTILNVQCVILITVLWILHLLQIAPFAQSKEYNSTN